MKRNIKTNSVVSSSNLMKNFNAQYLNSKDSSKYFSTFGSNKLILKSEYLGKWINIASITNVYNCEILFSVSAYAGNLSDTGTFLLTVNREGSCITQLSGNNYSAHKDYKIRLRHTYHTKEIHIDLYISSWQVTLWNDSYVESYICCFNPDAIINFYYEDLIDEKEYTNYYVEYTGLRTGSAYQLANSHKLWGQPFNGTKDIDGSMVVNGDIVVNGKISATGGVNTVSLQDFNKLKLEVESLKSQQNDNSETLEMKEEYKPELDLGGGATHRESVSYSLKSNNSSLKKGGKLLDGYKKNNFLFLYSTKRHYGNRFKQFVNNRVLYFTNECLERKCTVIVECISRNSCFSFSVEYPNSLSTTFFTTNWSSLYEVENKRSIESLERLDYNSKYFRNSDKKRCNSDSPRSNKRIERKEVVAA